MKKIEILIICCLIVSLLGACGSKETPIQVTGQNGAVYNSYQEACTAQDFVAAHMFLDRMKAEASNAKGKKQIEASRKVEEATEYITNKEILLLMSLDDETAFNRITFLLKENDLSDAKNDEYCDMVVDLALDMGKIELVKRMTNFYKGKISKTMLRKIVEKLYISDGDEDIDFVVSLTNRYNEMDVLMDAAVEKGDETIVVNLAQNYNGTMGFYVFRNVMDFLAARNYSQYNTIFEQLSTKVTSEDKLLDYAIEKRQKNVAKRLLQNQKSVTIDNKEMISKLASLNDKQYSDMVLLTLVDVEKTIPTKPSTKGYLQIYGTDYEYYAKDHCEYNKAAKNYNNECKSLLNIAIANKNLYLAKNVISRMKQEIIFTVAGSWALVDKNYDGIGCNAVKASFSDEEIKAAKQILKDAINNGSFK